MADRNLEKDLGLVGPHGDLVLKQGQSQSYTDAKGGLRLGVRLVAGNTTLDQANGTPLLTRPRAR